MLVGIFVIIGHSVPQRASYPPRALTQEAFSKLSPDELLASGRELFGAGGERCSQCHILDDGPPGRGPSLAGVGARAASRKRGLSAREYILESLVEPKAYVAKGFAPIMPEVYKSPLDLSEFDILAVTAFLESLGGKVTVTRKDTLKPEWSKRIATAKKAGGSRPPKGDLAHGKSLFYQEMRCLACHRTLVEGKKVGGGLGPDLSGVGLIQGPDYLRESIVEPGAVVVAPFPDEMPKHFKENLSAQDVDDLIVFLLSLRESS